jgi:hypothetical protein
MAVAPDNAEGAADTDGIADLGPCVEVGVADDALIEVGSGADEGEGPRLAPSAARLQAVNTSTTRTRRNHHIRARGVLGRSGEKTPPGER